VLSFDIAANGQSATYSINNIAYYGKADLTGASRTISGTTATYSNDTIAIDKDTDDEGGTAQLNYLKAEFDTVVGEADTTSTYYTSGTFTMTSNDWTGFVTNKGATTGPAYSMVTASGTEATGTVAASASLKLKKAAASLHNRVKARFNFHR
jgi:hypothetical protein